VSPLGALVGLALAGLLGPVPLDEPDWPAVWDDLLRLEALDAGAPEAGGLALDLDRIAQEQGHTPRGELLRHHLARLEGTLPEQPPGFGGGDAWPFEGRESWLAAEVVPPGAPRVRAILRSMDLLAASADGRFVMLAWNTAVEEARALRLNEGALPIQTRLHEEFQATWSGLDLSLTWMWLGHHAVSDRLLAEAIALEEAAGNPTADIWSRRGIGALAAGDKRRALDYLGRALARGSSDAAVVLARMDLDAGRRRAARIGFRALSWDEDPGAWALRGWGLTLLPESDSRRITDDRSMHPNGQ